MSALSRHLDQPLVRANWEPDVGQMLDEHHLTAWSDLAGRRLQFAVGLGQFLGAQRDTEVCPFYGRYITDLESFCHQLERAVPGPSLARRISGPGGITDLLRTRTSHKGRPASKFRYYIWHDADVLLQRDRALFGQLVDALAGVAAECEYVSDDLLIIQRSVLVGGAAISEYCKDPKGQCRSWFDDGMGEPFWKVVTGIDAPAFNSYPIDVLGTR